eukprot:8463902-Prorocentrum_lima.AAC.1
MQQPPGPYGQRPSTPDVTPQQPPARTFYPAGSGQSWAFRVLRANGTAASLFGHRDGRHCVWELSTYPHHRCDAQLGCMGRALEVWIRRHGSALQPPALQPLHDFSQGLQGEERSPLRGTW